MAKRPKARVVDSRLVKGRGGDPDHYVVTITCPHCDGRHTHGWTARNRDRVPHCTDITKPNYRLVWKGAPAEAKAR